VFKRETVKGERRGREKERTPEIRGKGNGRTCRRNEKIGFVLNSSPCSHDSYP